MRLLRATADGFRQDDGAIAEIDGTECRGENADIGLATGDDQRLHLLSLEIGV